MTRCVAREGRCQIECEDGCGCVYIIDANQCICECFGDTTTVSTLTATIGPATLVDVSVNQLQIDRFVRFANRLMPRQPHVAGPKATKTVTLSMKRARLSTVFNSAGLEAKKPRDEGTRKRRE